MLISSKISKKTKVKSKKGIISKKIDKLIIGDRVSVIEKNGKYAKVRTPLGNIGYVKTNRLSDEKIIKEDEIFYEIIKFNKENLYVYSIILNIIDRAKNNINRFISLRKF